MFLANEFLEDKITTNRIAWKKNKSCKYMTNANPQWSNMTAEVWGKSILETRLDVSPELILLYNKVISTWKDIRYWFNVVQLF